MNDLLFSIIIPTKQRHDTLKSSIQSVLNQTSDNFEIIVSDNFSTPETFEVVNSFSDARIKYCRASASLSMADNWELGLSKSIGDYIFILGDDDALMPDALEIANELISLYGYKIISWRRFFYAWDSSIVPWLRNHLGVNLQQIAELRNSRNTLRKFYQNQAEYEQLPMAYNSFVHRSIIDQAKLINKRYFDTHCPDSFSGIVNACFSANHVYLQRALSITGTSGHSNGAAHLFPSLNDDKSNSKMLQEDKAIIHECHSAIIPNEETKTLLTVETAVADVQLKAKDILFPEDNYLSLNIGSYLQSLSQNINRDPNTYEGVKKYIQSLAFRYNISVDIPDQEEVAVGQPFQGITTDDFGRSSHLRINCAQVGIFNVADAAKLALSVLPHHSQLRIYEAPDLRLYNQGTQTKIIVDGVFFQLHETGIARVWKSLLDEWATSKFSENLVVLDRAGTAPKIPGISYYQIPACDYDNTEADRKMLQQVCNHLKAKVFISTYYTTPIETPSVFMGYDMIPELLGADLSQPIWQEKQRSIEHASAYVTISGHTAKDLIEIHGEIDSEQVTVAQCGAQSIFKPATNEEILGFRNKYGISKPYFVIGSSGGYKNPELFFQAFATMIPNSDIEILVTGGHQLSEDNVACAIGSNVHCLYLDDEELSVAYSGAIALVYPSRYEGFGLPIVEAFASACPVITCPCGSIPEVAEEAAVYVLPDDVAGMTDALIRVQQPDVRATLIEAGLQQVQKFSWKKMADIMQGVLLNQTIAHLNFQPSNFIVFPDWSADEESVGEELVNVVGALVQSFDQNGRSLLLIDTTNAPEGEAVELLLSGIAMHLMMGEGIDVSEYLEISCTGDLSTMQWDLILPKIQGKIELELEDSSRASQFQVAVQNI
jgi:glycosyltransferase involved in cell wall biosynthesis